MNIVLFDDPDIVEDLLPMTYAAPVAALRVGMLTMAEKWQYRFPHARVSIRAAPYLAAKFPARYADENVWINSATCPDGKLVGQIERLNFGETLSCDGVLIAAKNKDLPTTLDGAIAAHEGTLLLNTRWKWLRANEGQLWADMPYLTQGRVSSCIDGPQVVRLGSHAIFAESGVMARMTILNAEAGPIYLGKNARIQEFSVICGPAYIGERTQIRMGAKIRPHVSIGPYCNIGGEVSHSIIQGFTNKAHEGFLGSSLIGEFCNIGAGTNVSNFKNTHTEVKIYNHRRKGWEGTNTQFFGLVMGSHSKCGIGVMFNSGAVVGASCNIFGSGILPKFIPSFSWGGAQGLETYRLPKALSAAESFMKLKNVSMEETDRNILEHIFHATVSDRY